MFKNLNYRKKGYGNIEVGSLVAFIDGSYACSINNKSKTLADNTLGLNEDIWTVVAINTPCPICPSEKKYPSSALGYGNNCIVANDNGDIAFCSRCNIIPVEKIVPIKEEKKEEVKEEDANPIIYIVVL